MTTTVFIVNGKPRAGKDTFVRFMRDALKDKEIPTAAFSSIEPVRDIIKAMGIKPIAVGGKSDADRKLLATIGQAVEEHSHFRTNECANRIIDFHKSNFRIENKVYFLHMREPDYIARVRAMVEDKHCPYDIKVRTIYLESDRGIEVDNPADAGTEGMEYDWPIANNGTLGELYDAGLEVLHIFNLI